MSISLLSLDAHKALIFCFLPFMGESQRFKVFTFECSHSSGKGLKLGTARKGANGGDRGWFRWG
uniref:Uncharacterized protein n=1 Tax=Rhizophora mucronata TaxID=61149 RepID=A0A2P2IWQ1_RHIMU